jgi:signal transduction histidine kinase
VVSAYGGTVELVDHPGRGARFRVCLPTLEGRIDEAA